MTLQWDEWSTKDVTLPDRLGPEEDVVDYVQVKNMYRFLFSVDEIDEGYNVNEGCLGLKCFNFDWNRISKMLERLEVLDSSDDDDDSNENNAEMLRKSHINKKKKRRQVIQFIKNKAEQAKLAKEAPKAEAEEAADTAAVSTNPFMSDMEGIMRNQDREILAESLKQDLWALLDDKIIESEYRRAIEDDDMSSSDESFQGYKSS